MGNRRIARFIARFGHPGYFQRIDPFLGKEKAMRGGVRIFAMMFALTSGLSAAQPQAADQPLPPQTEKERLDQCDLELCGIVNAQGRANPALRCDLTQTWYKDQISKAIKKGHLGWPFGDAHCSMTLKVDPRLLTPALKAASYTLKVPPQPVRCDVESEGGPHEVKAKMAPEFEFKSGKATSVSLGVQDIEGTKVLRNAVWAAWKLESNFGFFQDDFIKGVNKYIHHCQKLSE
jgi:hypothetical protein